MYALGVVIFALGILFSVCLHEFGHLLTAKAFGMKATRYFVGFGPTIFSFHKGETEYGLKAVPAGGFCKIIGMTPEEDEELGDHEQHRSFWRFSVPRRTLVLAAGSLTHFVLAFVLLWIAASFVGVPNPVTTQDLAAPVAQVSKCVTVDAGSSSDIGTGGCAAGQQPSPAAKAGLRSGDRIVSVDGVATPSYGQAQKAIQNRPGQQVTLGLTRAGSGPQVVSQASQQAQRTVTLTLATTTATSADGSKKAKIGLLGIAAQTLPATVTYGPVDGVVQAGKLSGNLATGLVQSIANLPSKIPNLFSALAGGQRDPQTPISVVGASRLGGEVVQQAGPQAPTLLLLLLASLNAFIGVFNLVPLLPLDGGHIALVWFERARAWWLARKGKPDPGRVDYNKLLPLTVVVVGVLLVFSVLTIITDIVNPVRLFG